MGTIKGVVVVEYDLDEDATESPFGVILERLQGQLPESPEAQPVNLHIAINDSAEAVLRVFS